jgi:hypothetical protein
MSKMSELDYEQRMAADQLIRSLREAAQAVIDRWESPKWAHDSIHTAELIFALRGALREHTLGCLSNTHQQLGEQLGEQLDASLGATDEGLWYEFIGCIDGTYGGRWMIASFAENASAVWPDGTAIYVRRGKR